MVGVGETKYKEKFFFFGVNAQHFFFILVKNIKTWQCALAIFGRVPTDTLQNILFTRKICTILHLQLNLAFNGEFCSHKKAKICLFQLCYDFNCRVSLCKIPLF